MMFMEAVLIQCVHGVMHSLISFRFYCALNQFISYPRKWKISIPAGFVILLLTNILLVFSFFYFYIIFLMFSNVVACLSYDLDTEHLHYIPANILQCLRRNHHVAALQFY
jgi:hypothetical protein